MVEELDERGDEGAIEQPDEGLAADEAQQEHNVENEADFHHICVVLSILLFLGEIIVPIENF